MGTKKRLERLRAAIKEKEIDGILISQPENRRYLSGFIGTAGYLLITQKGTLLATDFRYTEQATQQAPDFQVVQIGGTGTPFSKWFPQMLGDLGVKRLGFEGTFVSYLGYKELIDTIKDTGVELVPITGVLEYIRSKKEPEEVDAIARAQELTDRAFMEVTAKLRPGTTEEQLAWELEKFIRENGGEGLAFDTIVGAGPNGARPHHHTGDRPIAEGEPIVIDMGAKVDGYCADMTRTICLGRPDDTYKKIYDIVLGAQLAAEEMITAGMKGDEGDAIARKIIEAAGYGETFGHSLGHGIGLYVHEYPRLGMNSADLLEDGMVFSVEPGIYITGWGGVRIEDLVVLENGKPRVITKAPKV